MRCRLGQSNMTTVLGINFGMECGGGRVEVPGGTSGTRAARTPARHWLYSYWTVTAAADCATTTSSNSHILDPVTVTASHRIRMQFKYGPIIHNQTDKMYSPQTLSPRYSNLCLFVGTLNNLSFKSSSKIQGWKIYKKLALLWPFFMLLKIIIALTKKYIDWILRRLPRKEYSSWPTHKMI